MSKTITKSGYLTPLFASLSFQTVGIDSAAVYPSCLSRLSFFLSFFLSFISSPEHEVLMVSYFDQSMSVVRRLSSVVNNLF